MADAREAPLPPVAPPPALTEPGDADFRLMVDAVADYAIFLLDPGGVIRSWNTGARKIKGYEAHEVIGCHFSLFYPPSSSSAAGPTTS